MLLPETRPWAALLGTGRGWGGCAWQRELGAKARRREQDGLKSDRGFPARPWGWLPIVGVEGMREPQVPTGGQPGPNPAPRSLQRQRERSTPSLSLVITCVLCEHRDD